jgi:hypothetical protein
MYTVKMGVCTVWLKVSIGLTEYSGLQPLDPIEHPDIPISVSVVMLYRRETLTSQMSLQGTQNPRLRDL